MLYTWIVINDRVGEHIGTLWLYFPCGQEESRVVSEDGAFIVFMCLIWH